MALLLQAAALCSLRLCELCLRALQCMLQLAHMFLKRVTLSLYVSKRDLVPFQILYDGLGCIVRRNLFLF